jgi:F-type H+-transporting ATPase subunit a
MGEHDTWFDLIPGLRNTQHFLAHYLGRTAATDQFPTHFTMAHVWGAVLVILFLVYAGLRFRAAVMAHGRREIDDQALVPPARFGMRTFVEMFLDAVMGLMEGVMGPKNARRFLPLIGSLAFFIFFSNLLAIIPGLLPPTSMLKTNVALALSVFLMTHVYGVSEHGLKYFRHFAGPHIPAPWYAKPLTWLLAALMVVLEIISHLARPVSLSLRLMGNMAADHKVVFAFFVLVPLLVPVPFLILGCLVVIVQTLVFSLLSMVYISMAVAHEEH